jgi:hypothetical protein
MRLVQKSHINLWMLKPCTQQDRQCTHKVTLRSVRATAVAMEKQLALHNLSVRICSLCYPARNTYGPYFHLWSVPVYNIFANGVINGAIFETPLLNTRCMFWVSLHHLSETSPILSRNERDVIKKCILVFMFSAINSCRILVKLEFSRIIFEKNPQISTCMKISPERAEFFYADGRTNGQTWRN